MNKEKTETVCEIKCAYCGEWQRSMIQFGDAKSFFSSSLSGNKQQCNNPTCRKLTDCNKENMRFVIKTIDEKGISYKYHQGKKQE